MGNLPFNFSPDMVLNVLKSLAGLALGAATSHGLSL